MNIDKKNAKSGLWYKVGRWFRRKRTQTLALLLEFLWRGVIRFFYKPKIIFLVYGQERHKRHYWSKRTERRIGLLGLAGFINYRKNGKKLRGLMQASTISMEELAMFPSGAVTLTHQVKQCFPSATIALAGQLPGWLVRGSGGEPVKPPLIGGMRGTCFTVRQAVREITSDTADTTKFGRRIKVIKDVVVAVIGGAGYTGAEAVRVLAQDKYARVIAFDRRITEEKAEGNVVSTSDQSRLREADVVVVLTAKGDDIEFEVSYLNPFAIVVDDTHPMIGADVRRLLFDHGVRLFKITVADGSVSMFPQLPDFKPGDVPGCLLEAVVVTLCGPQVLESQEAFDHAAEDLGFKPRLEIHPER